VRVLCVVCCGAVQGYACPKFTNPADHYMRLMSRSEEVEEGAYVKRIEGTTRSSTPRSSPSLGAPRFLKQFLILLARAWMCYIRDPGVTKQRLIITLNIGIVVGLLFLQLGHYQSGTCPYSTTLP